MAAKLIWLGGSWYYLIAGLLALLAGWNVLKRNWWTGAAIYGVLLAITLVWALCEVGLDGWSLMPRVVSPLVLGLPFLIVALTSRIKADRQGGWLVVGTAAVLALAVWAASGFNPASSRSNQAPAATDAPGDWLHFGNDQGGSHFSPLGAIDRTNVAGLKQAWTVPLGPMPTRPGGQMDATPLKIGENLFVCTPFNDVFAIEAATGKVRWTFKPPRNNSGISVVRCRGVAYYEVPGASGLCSKRIYTAVSDGASLYALDADTGAICTAFGQNGRADLLRGIKQRELGYYNVSSAPDPDPRQTGVWRGCRGRPACRRAFRRGACL